MGYKIQFETGHTVEFETKPSDADIEEAYAHVSKQAAPKKLTTAQLVAQIPGSEGPTLTAPDYSKDESFVDKYIRGPIEAGAQLVTGAPVGLAAPIAGFVKKGLNPDSGKTADQLAGEFMQDYTYAPRGSAGQRYGEAIGEIVNNVAIPLAGVHGLPKLGQQYANHPAPSISTVLRDRMKGSKENPAVRSAIDDLNAPEAPVVKPTQEPLVDTKPGLLKSKEAYEAAVRERKLAQESAFSPETEALRAQEAAKGGQDMASLKSALDGFDEQVASSKAMQAAKAAQEALDIRQRELEQAVRRQQALDAGASERARQEAASVVSEAHRAFEAERLKVEQLAEEARINRDSQRMGKASQMEIDATPFNDGTGDVPFSGNTNGLVPRDAFTRIDENGMPIRADLSIEAQQLQNPLQRNLWGDELPQKSPQENPSSLTQAIDNLPKTQARENGKFVKGSEQSRAISRISGVPPLGSAARKALMKKQGGQLLIGERKKSPVDIKKTSEGYEALLNGKVVGYLKSNLTGEQSKMLGENANVDIVKVSPEVKGTGVGSALYKAWSEEHNGNIAPSGKTSKEAWNLWNNKYPEKVEAFVQQEAARIRQGAPVDQVLGNITNPTVAQRVLDAASNYKVGGKQAGKVLFGFNTKEKAKLFSDIPGIKDAARDVGNALIRTADEALALAKQTSDVSQNAVQRAFNAVTKGGTYLKGRVNNPVVHFAVDKFLAAEGLARGEINQKLGQEYLGSLRALSKDEYQAAFDLLNAADLNKKTITPEFMQKHGLSPALQEFLTTHQKTMDDVMGKINTARKAAGKDPITAREAYSAMSMSGDYRKVVYKNIDGVRTVVGVVGADRAKGKAGWTLEKIEKHMLAKDPTLEFGPMQDVTAIRGSSKGTPHDAFSDALKTLGENNPHVAELLNVLREVAKDDPSNYMGMQKHTMQKKGVWGMEGRKPWETAENNATQFFENQVRYIESAFNWSHLAEAAKDVNTVLRDAEVIKNHPNAVALSEKYMQNALGLNPSRAGRAIDDVFSAAGDFIGAGPSGFKKAVGVTRSVANTMMLSLNESFLAIQAIQGPAGIPAMTAFLRGRGLANKSTLLTQGLDYFVEANKTLVADKAGRELSAVDRGALAYAKKNHIYATDMVEHNTKTQADAGYYASKVLHGPAAVIETVTRAQTFLTFVKMMDDAGVKPKDGLYEQAQRFTDQVMNNYSAMEKPPVYQAMGQLGSMAYNLKSFAHNELSRWSMLAREIPATGNAMPLLTQMATTIALAGVMGLPFYSQFESLYDYITKKMGSPRSLTLDVIKMSENLAKEYGPNYEMFKNATSHGLFSLLGADVSKRIGLSDVLPSNLGDAAFAGGGKLAGMVGATAGAIVNPDERHLKAAAVALAPNVVASPLKSMWYTDEKGVYSTDPDKKRELITEINGTDRLLKKIGFTGINESTRRAKDYQLKQIEKAHQEIRDKALVQISYDLANGTPISQETVDKYFVDGQGDPSSFGASINDIAMKLNIPRDTLALINNASSNSITKAQALNRRVYANE